MHRVKYSIRIILPADLPTVTPIGEASRPMNDAELLNSGIHHLTGDFYSCICQEEIDRDAGEWKPVDGQSLPGTVITEGTLKDRHDRLPPAIRAQIMLAHVERPGKNKGDPPSVARIRMADIQPGDTVVARDLHPHSWVGEAR